MGTTVSPMHAANTTAAANVTTAAALTTPGPPAETALASPPPLHPKLPPIAATSTTPPGGGHSSSLPPSTSPSPFVSSSSSPSPSSTAVPAPTTPPSVNSTTPAPPFTSTRPAPSGWPPASKATAHLPPAAPTYTSASYGTKGSALTTLATLLTSTYNSAKNAASDIGDPASSLASWAAIAYNETTNSSPSSSDPSSPPSPTSSSTTFGIGTLLSWSDADFLLAPSEGSGDGPPGATIANVTQNTTSGGLDGLEEDPSLTFCAEWNVSQHGLFQAAHMFLASAFLIPSCSGSSGGGGSSWTTASLATSSPPHVPPLLLLLLRAILLATGFALSAIWASTVVCSGDALAWSLALSLANAFRGGLLARSLLLPPNPTSPPTSSSVASYFLNANTLGSGKGKNGKAAPMSAGQSVRDVFTKVFQPLRISRSQFRELAKEARLEAVAAGDTYATEDVTNAHHRLSILLHGKLKVTCNGTLLHHITPHQFIDSPEWEAASDDPSAMFQVTITAEEDSVFLCWSRNKLEKLLAMRPLLGAVIHNLIGKDITQKLYSLNEHLNPHPPGNSGRRGDSGDKWRCAESEARFFKRSMSVDAVNTGSKGRVRSMAWKLGRPFPSNASECSMWSPIHSGWLPEPVRGQDGQQQYSASPPVSPPTASLQYPISPPLARHQFQQPLAITDGSQPANQLIPTTTNSLTTPIPSRGTYLLPSTTLTPYVPFGTVPYSVSMSGRQYVRRLQHHHTDTEGGAWADASWVRGYQDEEEEDEEEDDRASSSSPLLVRLVSGPIPGVQCHNGYQPIPQAAPGMVFYQGGYQGVQQRQIPYQLSSQSGFSFFSASAGQKRQIFKDKGVSSEELRSKSNPLSLQFKKQLTAQQHKARQFILSKGTRREVGEDYDEEEEGEDEELGETEGERQGLMGDGPKRDSKGGVKRVGGRRKKGNRREVTFETSV
ncbi:uncharacterized protein LOC124154174 [Ischnura elegans]|uniref:uncharacterized protein LOC124154174 n=1 Tax=Ischnura elegans TaxID=197161 RepID=UPI001ED8B7C9|nr:uncharacterized protein LOC124154174 [Ischnura elegans]